jgi:hypothetical protein
MDGDEYEGNCGPDPLKGGSIFSRPLNCPRCQHTFEIRQPDPERPDHLFGTCSHCRTQAHLEVGDGGRIKLIELPRMPSPVFSGRL